MATGTLDINGARLWYEEAGQGLPVVFVHAGIADHRMWDEQFPVFARQYRAIRYDQRGFGESPMPEGAFNRAEDLYGVMRALGVERAALIGCSMGGAAILDLALEHPERVAALVTVGAGMSGFPFDENYSPAIVDEIVAAEKAGDSDRMFALSAHYWVDGPEEPVGRARAEVRDAVEQMIRKATENRPDTVRETETERPAYGRLGEIRAPVLAIYGSVDEPDMGRVAKAIGEQVSGARVVCMENTAHVPNMERPEEFNQIVLEFLKNIS